ncbi:unnamed protein product [Urochloa decumbens]|uniref:Glycosyltransferase n=1 Tax=Urochloa decumbens TaxID=240449 RepID=A0ABC9GEP7_9POAL
MMATKKTVVLYPGFGVGHLTPMLELAKSILRHGGAAALDVAVALAEPPATYAAGFHAAVARAQAANPSVSFHVLPAPAAGELREEEEPLVTILRFLRDTSAPLRDFLRSRRPPAAAVVLDMFCADALGVAAELALPAYFLFPSGAAGLAVFLALPAARAAVGAGGFGSLGADAVLTFHGAPPLRVSELSQGLAEDGESCRAMLRVAARIPEGARGILVNSFEKLEPRAMEALRDGRCLPDRPTPPVYCVGPLVSPGGAAAAADRHECLRWMDAQPDRSVVFLCFGSLGSFPKHQLDEIAAGLESSGQRFLWVVRSPRPPGAGEKSDESLDALLPAGFLEKTKDRGLVVNSWAPQVDVLRHRAAAAFVTHCGWNSTLEGVAAGVPLLCWPLYAEQKMNKVRIVEDMRLGVGMEMDEEGFVTAEEVEKKVRWVMEGDDGEVRELRERVAKAKELAAEAVEEGGPSDLAFVEFLKDLLEAHQGVVHA